MFALGESREHWTIVPRASGQQDGDQPVMRNAASEFC
jgi:hypothetical protein